jgi:integrase
LSINVPNPAHAQFIARESSDPLEGTRALTATRARQLMGLPAGDGVLDYRDRAILKTYLYTGVRLATACRLRVRDFHQDGDEATLTINEKGNRHRTIGIHFAAAEAIAEYITRAGLESGPLFRARRAPRADELGEQPMSEASMYRVVADYLAKLPGAVKDGARIFSTHSLRATTATLLLDAGVDIRKVGGHSSYHPALPDAAPQPGVYRYHAGQAVSRARWPAPGLVNCGEGLTRPDQVVEA